MADIWYGVIYKDISKDKPKYYLKICTDEKKCLDWLAYLDPNYRNIEKRWIIEDAEKYFKNLLKIVDQITVGKINEKTLVRKIHKIQNKT